MTIVIKAVTIKVMKLSAKLRYASRLLALLAESKGVINTTEIGKHLGVSPLYLRNIALKLEKNGIIKSIRGAKGGYELKKDPSDISLYRLAEIYGDLEIVKCLEEPEICEKSNICKTRRLWMKLRNCIESFLRQVTIQDLVKDNIGDFENLRFEKEEK